MTVKLVYGSPCSGKTTFVRQEAGENDIIYDYDALIRAATQKLNHTADRHNAHYCIIEIRNALFNSAKDNDKIETFWLITHYPSDYLRELIKDIETEEIFIKATKEECYERLENDDSRPDKSAWKEIIDKWFSEHSDELLKGGSNMKNKKFWKWKNETVIDTSAERVTTERVLFLDGVIAEESWFDDDVTPKKFKNELNSGTGNITVWINSPGGDCIAAAQIYNMLTEYKGKVIVKIDGIAASAASVIAMAGDEVLMSPVSMLMIHNPSTIAMGESSDFQKAIDMLNEVKESIINAYAIKTDLSRAKLSHLMDSETWLNANKAVELGFADRIIERAGTENTSSVLFSCKEANNVLFNKLTAKYGKPEMLTKQEENSSANEHSVSEITERLNYIKKFI